MFEVGFTVCPAFAWDYPHGSNEPVRSPLVVTSWTRRFVYYSAAYTYYVAELNRFQGNDWKDVSYDSYSFDLFESSDETGEAIEWLMSFVLPNRDWIGGGTSLLDDVPEV